MKRLIFKKGQLSIETMILYGLIALVALAAVAALIYFDVLNLGSYLPDKCDVGGSGDLSCEEIRLATDGTNFMVTLGMRNIGQRAISDVRVCIKGDTYLTTSTCGNLMIPPATAIIPNGEIGVVSITDSTAGKAKGVFNGAVTVTYKYVGGVVEQASVGTLRAKIVTITP